MSSRRQFADAALAGAIALAGTIVGSTPVRGVSEVEPNDTSIQADLSVVQLTGSGEIIGSISPATDSDKFRLVLAQGGTLRFETFYADTGDCAEANFTTRLRVLDAVGTQIWADSSSGIQLCSAIVASLPAGTYYVEVEEDGQNATLSHYRLQVALQANAGSETEPDDTPGTASATLLGASDSFAVGGHQVGVDGDYYSIDVADGESIRAEVVEGSGAETCESLGIDSRLTLFAPGGVTVLTDDDDSGRGFCSRIDGTGGAPVDAGAHELAPGTYFLLVRASASADPGGAQFDYRLDFRKVKLLLFADDFEFGNLNAWSSDSP